jgi:hypothetical protein
MKKFFFLIILIIVFLLTLGAIYLSVVGHQTSKFNSRIIKEVKQKDPKIELQLEKIKIKLDIKKFQLFFSTKKPKIQYQNIKIPVTEIKIYSKISKILSSKIEVNQITFKLEKFKIENIQKIAIRIKPSNFKAYLLNNLKKGEVEKVSFDLNMDEDWNIISYKVNGVIKKVNIKIKNYFTIKDISFNFILDNNLALINSINATYNGIEVTKGSIDVDRRKNLEIKGKINTSYNLKETQLNKQFTKVKFFKENKIQVKGSLLHEFNLKINNNYKIVDYNYKSTGIISQSQLILNNVIKNQFLKKEIKKVLFKKIKLEIRLNKKNKNLLLLDGLYSTNNSDYKKFKIRNNLKKKNQNFDIDLDLTEKIFFDLINFKTDLNKNNNLKTKFSIKNNKVFFKSIDFSEGKNAISVKELLLNNKNEVVKLVSLNLLTLKNNKENNNLKIIFGKKISIFGKIYDSSNLLKLLSADNKSNLLKNFTKEVEIKIENLITSSQIPLKNFNLIGLIEKGKFNKMSAKSEFSEDQYLDISLKKDLNNKKILEVYSDSPEALLSEYKFFEGINGGKLLYRSIIDKNNSVSKLTIEDFKIIKAPAFATLLTLADLSGVADILSGKGISFDFLEINLKDDSNVTTVEEILALGTSVSLQMDGYIEKKTGLISLSGTLVPAKTLNSLVSKIPVIGNILVGDKIGEGVFGVSFKIKGLPGRVKTSINPVKTITPRFITRALEKAKKK